MKLIRELYFGVHKIKKSPSCGQAHSFTCARGWFQAAAAELSRRPHSLQSWENAPSLQSKFANR